MFWNQIKRKFKIIKVLINKDDYLRISFCPNWLGIVYIYTINKCCSLLQTLIRCFNLFQVISNHWMTLVLWGSGLWVPRVNPHRHGQNMQTVDSKLLNQTRYFLLWGNNDSHKAAMLPKAVSRDRAKQQIVLGASSYWKNSLKYFISLQIVKTMHHFWLFWIIIRVFDLATIIWPLLCN